MPTKSHTVDQIVAKPDEVERKYHAQTRFDKYMEANLSAEKSGFYI